MTLTIDLPEEKTAILAARAREQGVTAEQFATQFLDEALRPGAKKTARCPHTGNLGGHAAGGSRQASRGRREPARPLHLWRSEEKRCDARFCGHVLGTVRHHPDRDFAMRAPWRRPVDEKQARQSRWLAI